MATNSLPLFPHQEMGSIFSPSLKDYPTENSRNDTVPVLSLIFKKPGHFYFLSGVQLPCYENVQIVTHMRKASTGKNEGPADDSS